MKSAHILPLLAALGVFNVASTASAAWVRLPNDSVRLVNLAADRIANTSIQSANGVSQPGNLLDEDPTKVSRIDAGQSSVVIRLNSQQNIDMVVVSNGGAAGSLNVLGSVDNKSWSPLTQTSFDSNEAAISVSFAPAQLRYVRLDFDASSSGAINDVTITGAAQSSAADSQSSSKQRSNLACAIGGARPIYANPTPANLGSKEFDVNIIRFPKSSQPATTVVYDLGSLRAVDDVSLAYDFRPTRVDVYAYDQLPEKKDWRGKLTLDPSFLDTASPVVSGVDTRGIGRIKLTPDSAFSTQYLIIRVQPLAQSSGLSGAIQGIAAEFGFEGSQQVATPAGGSTLGSIFINGALSSSAFAQAASAALGGEQPASTDTPNTALDQADTVLIPPSFLGQYDYRMTSANGGGGDDDDDDRPIVNNIVRPIIRPVQVINVNNPDLSGANP